MKIVEREREVIIRMSTTGEDDGVVVSPSTSEEKKSEKKKKKSRSASRSSGSRSPRTDDKSKKSSPDSPGSSRRSKSIGKKSRSKSFSAAMTDMGPPGGGSEEKKKKKKSTHRRRASMSEAVVGDVWLGVGAGGVDLKAASKRRSSSESPQKTRRSSRMKEGGGEERSEKKEKKKKSSSSKSRETSDPPSSPENHKSSKKKKKKSKKSEKDSDSKDSKGNKKDKKSDLSKLPPPIREISFDENDLDVMSMLPDPPETQAAPTVSALVYKETTGNALAVPSSSRRSKDSDSSEDADVAALTADIMPAEKPNRRTKVLVLISSQTPHPNVVRNQKLAMTILDTLCDENILTFTYDVLDGANPAQQEQRNQLFEVARRKPGEYPLFFSVLEIAGGSSFVYKGDWDWFESEHESGTLHRAFASSMLS